MVILAVVIAWSIFELATWKAIGAGIVTLGAVIAGLGTLHSKVVSPWIAKPLAKQLRKEFREEIREVLLEPETMQLFEEKIQEVFTSESGRIIDMLSEVLSRLQTVETNQRQYMKQPPTKASGASKTVRAKRLK